MRANIMLFDLAKAIGLEAAPAALTLDISDTPERQIAAATPPKSDASDNPTIPICASPKSDCLPKYFYRAEEFEPYKAPKTSTREVRKKYSDEEWIQAKLRRVKRSRRDELVEEYAKRYKAAYDSEPDEIKKTNRARFSANRWLLEITK